MPSNSTPGLDWSAFIQHLVADRGSLAAVAQHLATRRGFSETPESVERGLRRLRARGNAPGGVWGGRLLRAFPLPTAISARLRWMGRYHSRFTDLPCSIALDLLHLWDRPPVSESTERIWLLMGLTSVALRRRDREEARAHLEQAMLLGERAPIAGRIERALVRAFAIAHRDDAASARTLDKAAELLAQAELEPDERACLQARWTDQVAYRRNRPRDGSAPDHAAALALYEALPDVGVPPFALCRRANGVGWSLLKLGRREAALDQARISVRVAGDGGSLRLRAMALSLLAAALGRDDGAAARARAIAIARRLEDEALRLRLTRRS